MQKRIYVLYLELDSCLLAAQLLNGSLQGLSSAQIGQLNPNSKEIVCQNRFTALHNARSQHTEGERGEVAPHPVSLCFL